MFSNEENKNFDECGANVEHRIFDVEIKEKFVKIVLDNILKKMTDKIRLIGSTALYYSKKEYSINQNINISKTLLNRDFDILTTNKNFGELVRYFADKAKLNIINHQIDKKQRRIPYFQNESEMKERGIEEIISYEWTFDKSSSDSGANLLLDICNMNNFVINLDIIVMNDPNVSCDCGGQECKGENAEELSQIIEKFSPLWPIHCSARNIMCYYDKNVNIQFSLFKKNPIFKSIVLNHAQELCISDYFESLKFLTWMTSRKKYADHDMKHIQAHGEQMQYNIHKTINYLFYEGVNVKYTDYSFDKLRAYIITKKIKKDEYGDDDICSICQYGLNCEEFVSTQAKCECRFHFSCLAKYQMPYLIEYMRQLRSNELSSVEYRASVFQFDNPDGVQIGGHKCPNCRTQGISTKFGRNIGKNKWIFPSM